LSPAYVKSNNECPSFITYLGVSEDQKGDDEGGQPANGKGDPEWAGEDDEDEHPEGKADQHEEYTRLEEDLKDKYHGEKHELEEEPGGFAEP
jgi:hypothetical protein